MNMLNEIKNQISTLPKTPGVYFFRSKSGEIIYIGKATSLRDRVRSYWVKELNRAPSIQIMVSKIATIEYETLESSIEALIAEANYIKKHLPKYNVRFRDDKSYFFVKLDESDGSGFARLSMVHKNEILNDEPKIRYFGPYTSGKHLRLALKTIRKLFPYRSCTVMPHKPCLQYHIKRCSAPCIDLISRQEYRRTVKNIVALLEGKKAYVINQLKRQMLTASKKKMFEQATILRNQYLGLTHLKEAARISDFDIELDQSIINDAIKQNTPTRIEGYDVSNLNGREASVAMVVFEHGQPVKRLYRRFTIKTVVGPNDYAMLQEAIGRRLKRANVVGGTEDMINPKTWDISDNDQWQLPDLMIIDGGPGQVSAVLEVLNRARVNIPLIGIAKGPSRKSEDLYFSQKIEFSDIGIIRLVRDEAHRFAGAHHRILRSKALIKSELDNIAGVGPVTKKTLLKSFGSVEIIKKQSVESLSTMVNRLQAQAIHNYFVNAK